MTCCGKRICDGCIHAPLYDNQGNKVDNQKCPFCRTPHPTGDEMVEREKKRIEVDDPIAIYNIGNYYCEGSKGFPKDKYKALEHFHRAGELGYAKAYCKIGIAYYRGEGVEVDEKKAIYYYQLGAMGGDAQARFNLGIKEAQAGNTDRAMRHFMIAIRAGHTNSLNAVQKLYSNGHATKEDYPKALQAYQEYLSEIKNPQRDEAAAFSKEMYRYY